MACWGRQQQGVLPSSCTTLKVWGVATAGVDHIQLPDSEAQRGYRIVSMLPSMYRLWVRIRWVLARNWQMQH
eukprot:3648314-Lingulodinium_polyedra.AAC.1